MKRITLVAFLLLSLESQSKADAIVDLYRPINSELKNLGGGVPDSWNVKFKPLVEVELTGLGIVFDPIERNVVPSLSLSLWKDDQTTNDNLIASMSPNLSVAGTGFVDFYDTGLGHYLFRLLDFPDRNPVPQIRLEAGRTYVLFAQVNIDGLWPRQRADAQELPFVTADGNFLVASGGRFTSDALPFQDFPALFVEAGPATALVPEPTSIVLWSLIGIACLGVRRWPGRIVTAHTLRIS